MISKNEKIIRQLNLLKEYYKILPSKEVEEDIKFLESKLIN